MVLVVSGYIGVNMLSPKVWMSGMRITKASRPPASMLALTLGPMMYPTPSIGGETSNAITAPFSRPQKSMAKVAVSDHRRLIRFMNV